MVSSLIGAGLISIEKNGQAVDIELLASREDLSEFDRRLIDILMPGGATSRRVYKKYTESFATAEEIRKALIGDIKEKNWWNKPLRAWNKRTSIIGAWVSAASLVGVLLILDSIEIRDPDGNVVTLVKCSHRQRCRRCGGSGTAGSFSAQFRPRAALRREQPRAQRCTYNRIIPQIPCAK